MTREVEEVGKEMLQGNKVQRRPARFLAVLLQPLPTCLGKKHPCSSLSPPDLASTPPFSGGGEGAGKPRRTLLGDVHCGARRDRW